MEEMPGARTYRPRRRVVHAPRLGSRDRRDTRRGSYAPLRDARSQCPGEEVDIASVGIGPTGDHVAGLTDSIE
jgi:hypothetical protein